MSNKSKNRLAEELDAFRDVAYAFATACETDGFGSVKSVDLRYISSAMVLYKKTLRKYGDE
jgi:hypothetical protein